MNKNKAKSFQASYLLRRNHGEKEIEKKKDIIHIVYWLINDRIIRIGVA